MISLLKLDYHRLKYSFKKFFRENDTELWSILAQIIAHIVQLLLIHFFSYLLQSLAYQTLFIHRVLKIFICTMATIVLIISFVLIEPDKITQDIMCVQIALTTCQVMVLFGDQYAIIYFPIWMIIFWVLSIKLGSKDQQIKQGANILKSGFVDDALNQDDFSYYSNGSVTHQQIKTYITRVDVFFRAALLATLALTNILPRNLILALDEFSLGQKFVGLICKVLLYELAFYKCQSQGFFRNYLSKRIPNEAVEQIEILIEFVIFVAFFAILNILSSETGQLYIIESIFAVAIAKIIFRFLAKYIHWIFVPIMLLTIFQLVSAIVTRYLVSLDTREKFFFKLNNTFELVIFAVLYSICWRPPSILLHFRNVIRLLIMATYLIQPLYYIGKLLVSNDYSSIAHFIQHDIKFIIYRKLIFYILLTILLVILEGTIDDQSIKQNEQMLKKQQAIQESVKRLQNLRKEINQYQCYYDYFLENTARLFQRSEEVNLINMKQYHEFLMYIGDSVRVALFFLVLFNIEKTWQSK